MSTLPNSYSQWLDRLLQMMTTRGATHAQLTSGEPIQLCTNGRWQQGQVVVPSQAFQGLDEIARQKQNGDYHFRVLGGPPVTLVISRLGDDGRPLPVPPLPHENTSGSPSTTPVVAVNSSSTLPPPTPPPLTVPPPAPPPLPPSPDLMSSDAWPADTWRPPTRAEENAEKIFVSSVVVVAALIFFGLIGFFAANSINRKKDYSTELALTVQQRFNAETNDVQVREISLTRDEPREYTGEAIYEDGDRGDVSVQIQSRDWLGRPDDFSWSVTPRSYAAILEGQIRVQANEVYARRGAYFRVRSISLTRNSRHSYGGIVEFDDRTRGGISVEVLSFNTDGTPANWSYSIRLS